MLQGRSKNPHATTEIRRNQTYFFLSWSNNSFEKPDKLSVITITPLLAAQITAEKPIQTEALSTEFPGSTVSSLGVP